MTTIGGEGGGKVVADEEFGAVAGLDAGIEGGVAGNHACKVSHLVQNGGEQVVATESGGALSGFESRGSEGLVEFTVIEGSGVDEPA